METSIVSLFTSLIEKIAVPYAVMSLMKAAIAVARR